MRVRRPLAVVASLALAVGLAVAVTMMTGPPRPAVPRQQVWVAAAVRSHRVPAAATRGRRVVDGPLVPAGWASKGAARGKRSPGSAARDTVRVVTPPRPLRFPVRGKAAEKVRALPRPAAAAKAGYNQKTSRQLAPHSANQDVYANADGTKTAFDFAQPVNYLGKDGTWIPISTTLVPVGPALPATGPGSADAVFATPQPTSPSTSPSVSPSVNPGASGSPSPSSSPNPSGGPSPSGSSSPSAVPAAGWTEKSEGQAETFAPYASAPDLVTVPLSAGHTVAFGIAGAAPVPGTAQGSSVSYADAIPDSTIGFDAGTGMVKERIVLDSAAAPTTWIFPLDLTGLRALPGPDGVVDFTDAAGRVVAYVPRGFMSDSNINPHSGDGVTSWGVRYSLITVGGRQAIKVTLDTAWLDSAARVFPVTVDPSVSAVNSNGTTYVQYPDTNDFSSDVEVHVGTWDGGSDKAESYLSFTNVASSLKNDTVLGAELGLFNTWSYSCQARAVYVYPVTSSWSVTGNKSWPGPSTSAAVGRASFASGWVPYGSSVSPCSARWEGIRLDQAGTNLVNGWTHGTIADNGLALGASNSDSYAWKKFASDASGAGDPFLAVTYTTDGASYRLASRKPLVQVLPGQNGKFAIKVTNTGSSTWTPSNGYELSYEAYNSKKKLVANHPVFTAMPSTVAPGQTVTVDAVVNALAAGSYAIDFDMYSGATGSSPVSFSSQGIPPFAIGLAIPQPPPTISAVYPPAGFVSPTLRQQLATVASTATGTITYSFTLTCKPPAGQTCVDSSITSGSIANPYWTPPAADMQWNTPYQWAVTTTVNGASTSVSGIPLEPEVPQPGMTAGLGDTSGQAYDPLSGNYSTSATEAAVATAGMPLQITRTYNSLDPRSSLSFGAGWSSVLDMSLRPDNDGTGNSHDSTGDVVVTLQDGRQVRFGENGNGSYAPPFGSHDVLVHNTSAGTWTLRDSSDRQYTFTSAGLISKIADPNGRSLQFAYNSSNQVTTITDGVSERTLTLTWAKPTGAVYSHVSSVATQAPAAGQSGYSWDYAYSGDELAGVCGPANDCTATGCPSDCTAYSYATGSHYLAGVLDSGARSYWQLGEASGTAAVDEVDANLGTTDGTYHNVTLGVAGPLAGSSETAAAFNGTSSSVSLPGGLLTDSSDVAIELWFKAASGGGGVLFSYDADALSNANGDKDHRQPALYIGGNGELYGEFWNGSVDPIHTSTSVTDGKWHHVVLTASNSSQSLYLDGTRVGSALAGQINQINMSVDTIGAGFWTSWPEDTQGGTATAIGYFNGDIAQVAVYPHPLAVPDITTHHGLGTTPSPELQQVTLPSGNVSEQASYDPATDRLATYTDPDGGTWSIGQPLATGYRPSADSLGEVVDNVTVTDPAGRQDTYSYDMLDGGRLISFSNGLDAPVSYGYDTAGFLTTAVNSDGDLACMTNDQHGNVLTRTWYPLEPTSLPGGGIGTVASCGGSAASSATCTSSLNPCTTFYGYAAYNASNPLDPVNGELTSVRDGRSASSTDNTYLTSYAYNGNGQLTSVTTPATSDFPSGRKTAYTYSAGTEPAYNGGTTPPGLLLSSATPGGATTSYQYYSDGDLAQVTQPSGRYTVYTYDLLGRVTTSTVYTTSFPAGQTTLYSYDALNRPLTVQHPGVTNAVTNVTHTPVDSYAYDADGNELSLTRSDLTGGDPSRTTSYTYNDHDEMASMTQPAGATPTGGTSPAGGASSADPQGATTGYEYDAFGNLSKQITPNGNEYRYTYNEYSELDEVVLYTPSTSESDPTTTCATPAIQDQDGGCDLVLDSYAYDPSGMLAASTDAMGRITNYSYDNNQDLQTVETTDPSTSPTTGRLTTYGYDGAANKISKAVSAVSGGLVGATTVTDYNYDAADRLTSTVADAGSASGNANRTVSYTYDKDNHVLSQTTGTTAQGGTSVTSYTYDTAGDRTSQTVADGSASLETTWIYDQNGLPLSMTTPLGNASGATAANYTTNYTYDPADDLGTVTGPPVQAQTYTSQTPATTRPVTSYGYDTFGDKTQTEDPDGNITMTGYDGDSRVTSVTQPPYTPPGGTASITKPTTYAYDENGNLAQVTDPAGNVTSYGYDALGDVTSITQPQLPGQSAPGVWRASYDAARELLSVTDPLNNTTRATYDYFGERASTTDALNNTTTFGYDHLGDPTTQTSPDGVATTATYDSLGELTSVADSFGDTTGFAYDDAGRVSRATYPDGSYQVYGYDQAGNQTSIADYGAVPSGQTGPLLRSESLGYDLNGDQTSVKDWNGNTATDAYNAAGELTSRVVPVSATSSITTSYGYDPAGNRTALTNGNQYTTWTTYNTWNLPESVIEPTTPTAPTASDTTWQTAYNADGQPSTVTQPGGVSLSYGYDPLGDLTSESGSGASASTAVQATYNMDQQMTSGTSAVGTDDFTYNADGDLTGTSGPSGASSYIYNGDRLVSSETDTAGTTSYTYDAADRLSTETDPLTGATLTWAYNADSNPASISYATAGTAGPVQSFGYDGLRRLTSDTLTSASGSVLASEAYGYDANGNVTSQATGGLLGTASASYAYDQANRLTSATSGGTTTGYGYDGDGNLTQAGATSNTYNAQDQLVSSVGSAGTTSYSYTLNGELSSVTPPSGSATNYAWDASGELISAGGVSYGYDSRGRLVTRTPGTGTAQSLSYLGTSTSVASDGSRDYTYTPSGSVTATGTPGGSAFATMSDQHGDVVGTFSPTSAASGLAGYSSYSPYGTRTATNFAQNLGFQGDYTDPSTGLVDMNARWYNPAAGTFVSNDTTNNGTPIPFTTDGNPYAYGNANPLTHTDPTGHQIDEDPLYWEADPETAFYAPDNEGDAEAIDAAEADVAYGEEQDYELEQALEEGADESGYGDMSEEEYQYYEEQQAAENGGYDGGGNGSGYDGGNGGNGPVEPPAPPPPPQDQFATANGDENIPTAPKALLTEPTITGDPTIPSDVTDGKIPTIDQVTEHFTEPTTDQGVKGVQETPAEAQQNEIDSQASDIGDNTRLLDTPTSEDGKPATPTADDDQTTATCGGMSFTATTRVLLASGKAIAISKLRKGDKVLATDTKTGKTTGKAVAAVLVHHDTDRYDFKARTAHGTAVIDTTRSHLFWDQDTRRWVKAAALPHGAHLRAPGGRGNATVLGGYTPHEAKAWMWDLTIPGDHDFYIQAAATAILVHNCPTDSGPADGGASGGDAGNGGDSNSASEEDGSVPPWAADAWVWEADRPGVDDSPQGVVREDQRIQRGDDLQGDGHYLYVVMQDGSLRAVSDNIYDEVEDAGHTSLTEKAPVIMAGTFDVDENGVIQRYDELSGHYMPGMAVGYADYDPELVKLREIARAAFERFGLPVSPDAVWDPWRWRG